MALVARLCGFRLVIDIQDLWPDSVDASGMASARTIRILDRICRFVYRRADHLIVQAAGMREKLIERGVPPVKISRIYNWASYRPDVDGARPKRPGYFADAINVVYGGNLGQAQALDYVIDAVELARKQVPALRLHLFGNGIERDALLRHAQCRPAANVKFHDALDRAQMDRIFDRADILIMHLKRDPLYEFTVPSKTQHYMACAKPIVAGVTGEAASILERCGGAIVCSPEDREEMAEALVRVGRMSEAERESMGRRARDHYLSQFSMNSAIEQTVAILADRRPRTPHSGRSVGGETRQ
jgi:glycosyltransferase involved in cell wall biosynthesis